MVYKNTLSFVLLPAAWPMHKFVDFLPFLVYNDTGEHPKPLLSFQGKERP